MSQTTRFSSRAIPDDLVRKWQSIVDILARVSGFKAALIMRVDATEIEVFIRNDNTDNPFRLGARTPLNTDLFCERAIATRSLVHCADALKDPVWINPIVTNFGFVCYYGLPLYWPDGNPFGTICILNANDTTVTREASELVHLFQNVVEGDLGELVRTTHELDESRIEQFDAESKYASIFHQLAIGLARIGLDGRMLEVNEKLCRIVGYTRNELMLKTFRQLTVEPDSSRDIEFLSRLLAGEIQSYSLEKCYRHKQGHQVWAQLTVSLVRTLDGEPDYLLSVVQDVTEKKTLQQSLERAQKLEAIGRLVGGIAHEFNNKLAIISGKLYLIRTNESRNDALIEQAESECYEAAKMIKGLLAYSRNEQTAKRPIALCAYLEEIITRLRPLIPVNIHLEIAIDGSPIIANVDPTQIQQIALNLVNNAIDAVENVRDPRVNVRLTTSDAIDEIRRTHPDTQATKIAKLEIEDNGVGIEAEALGKIFDPFYTTKPVNKGTGLGLAIVAGLVQQHEGVVEVESVRGIGTRFKVLLPLSDLVFPERDQAPVRERQIGLGKTVLVVDDNAAVLETTCDILETLGYSVLKARDGEEALSIYGETEDVDCVLTDVVMPKIGGVDLCRQLRERDPDVKLIFMTGYNNEMQAALSQNARLSKPIEVDDLRKTLAAVIGA
ncbi:MAG: PAS domain S-box protein [Hyphomicrobiales bacterium]|nr:PAS domain S-box protein [Hyphomicrobiales bacterium]